LRAISIPDPQSDLVVRYRKKKERKKREEKKKKEKKKKKVFHLGESYIICAGARARARVLTSRKYH